MGASLIYRKAEMIAFDDHSGHRHIYYDDSPEYAEDVSLSQTVAQSLYSGSESGEREIMSKLAEAVCEASLGVSE